MSYGIRKKYFFIKKSQGLGATSRPRNPDSLYELYYLPIFLATGQKNLGLKIFGLIKQTKNLGLKILR